MDFLGRSAAAAKLKAEMQEKINLAEKELKGLQDQMKIIKSM
jgi:ABC-type Fe3+-hydroxamate transport system substrate-binding protein